MVKLLQSGTIINEGRIFKGDLLIHNDRIEKIIEGKLDSVPGDLKIIDATGKYIIPGVIDDQVHFREPGLTHKGDIREGSRAAAAGGVTSFMDMPNVKPPTITNELLREKQQIAKENSAVNYSFYLGATVDNIDEIKKIDPHTTCGIKVFMGSSTGNMLVDSREALEKIFAKSPILIATHCEDSPTINRNLELYLFLFGVVFFFFCCYILNTKYAAKEFTPALNRLNGIIAGTNIAITCSLGAPIKIGVNRIFHITIDTVIAREPATIAAISHPMFLRFL